jgi:hypothetical protein
MIHRPHFQSGLFHSAEARLDDHSAFVGKRHIFGSQGVVVGDHHPLAVKLLRRFDLSRIELRSTLAIF